MLAVIVVFQAHHHYRTTIRNYVADQFPKKFKKLPLNIASNTNREQIKIDWHDYVFMKYEASRVGLGEQGGEVKLDHIDKALQDAMYHANGYDAYISDRVSLNRSLPDVRHPE
jgi:polypeptide N-acetylgalactosaminyltransferase